MTGKTFLIACLFLLAMQDVAAAGDGREAALVNKGQGDRFAAQGDYGKAAEEYLSALSLDGAAFNGNEKFRMAVTLLWAGKLEDAIAVLRSVIAENPKNHDARVNRQQHCSAAVVAIGIKGYELRNGTRSGRTFRLKSPEKAERTA
jgi:tetratricopeptide (TPR) repeat protein